MAKSKSSARKNPVYSKIENCKTGVDAVTKMIRMTFLIILMLLAIAGIVIKYYGHALNIKNHAQ